MTNKTYKTLLDAMDRKERNEGKGDYYSYIQTEDKDIKDFLINLVYSDEGIASGDNNLSYDVLYDAIAYMGNFTLKEFKALDVVDTIQSNMGDGFASVYTSERLAYLNINNEYEIMDALQEYYCRSISEACAIFYDQSVTDTVYMLQQYVLNH